MPWPWDKKYVLIVPLIILIIMVTLIFWAGQMHMTSKIAYRDYNLGITVINTDGSNPVRITPDYTWADRPAWSPDGSKIVFGSNMSGSDDIYVMNADGSNLVNLTNSPERDSYPAWSPDGSQIAFESVHGAHSEIYIMNADGTNPMRLTFDESWDEYPAWSPDGSWIAYSDFHGIFLINVSSGYKWDQIHIDARCEYPAWSPDGSQIAFESDQSGNREIYKMNVYDSIIVNLTNNPTQDSHPAWSPDGSKIAFASTRDDRWLEIYVMNADGSNQMRLTSDKGHYPAWGPLALYSY